MPRQTPALLPGGRAGLNLDGYAVSNGTQRENTNWPIPDWQWPGITAFLGMPARRSLAGSAPVDPFGGQRRPSSNAVSTALENAIPVSEALLKFLPQAVDQMAQNDLDARAALRMAEETILERLDAAAARRDVPGFVVTPPPTANLAPGEIALNFGIGAMISPLPNQAQWDALAAEFAASDPDVGVVNLQSGFFGSLDEMAGVMTASPCRATWYPPPISACAQPRSYGQRPGIRPGRHGQWRVDRCSAMARPERYRSRWSRSSCAITQPFRPGRCDPALG